MNAWRLIALIRAIKQGIEMESLNCPINMSTLGALNMAEQKNNCKDAQQFLGENN